MVIEKLHLHKHILAIGRGKTQEEAALNFVEKFIINIPTESKLYEVFIRKPLEYRVITNYDLDDIHEYALRISYGELEWKGQ